MKALYWEPPKAAELAGLGLRPEDFPPPECELWAENWPAIQFYQRISTQWRTGFSGVIGLDYNVVYHELDRQGLDREPYDEMLAAIRVIERAATDELNRRD